jgi:polyphosphate kinase
MTKTVAEPASPPDERLLNRELCWLAYNARVLELAADPSVPLLERCKLCRYFSSNLDEFFMVRVAGLLDQAASGLAVLSPDGRTPAATLAEIRAIVLELATTQSRLWRRELQPALAQQGIPIGDVEDCSPAELEELEATFDRQVYPVLTPLAVGPGQPFPYISGLSLSLGVTVRDPETGEERFARVKVPEILPRFLPIGSRGLYLPLERVMRHFLPRLFPDMEIVECCTFRVTRDADFEISDEADDLLEAVQSEVSRRRFGEVVRLEVSGSVSSELLERLQRGLDATDDTVYLVRGLLDLADLDAIVQLERPDLKEEPWRGLTHARLAHVQSADELFKEIRRGDVLVQHPYDSFATSFEAFVFAAADDPDVVAIKTTVYRTSDESPLVPALVRAAENGKPSVCLVELKARFDERRNIEWSRSLEQAGVHVVYGFPNLKIHAKTTLVVRREGGELVRYVHIGTGNYHSVTAQSYEDFGLFTADQEIAADVADLFNYLTGFGRPRRFRKVLVSPFDLRERLIGLIRSCADAAKAGKPARIRLKINNLTDVAVIDELYAASKHGVQIDVIARSICALRPGIDGLSENIRVRSVLGRFLEHSRLFAFEAGGETTYLLGSPDLMPRNLDHRVEIVTPVEDARARQDLSRCLDVLASDNSRSWELRSDGTWRRLEGKKGERRRGAQASLIRSARARAARRSIRAVSQNLEP